MALNTNKENVMSAISTLGYEVFRNGQFHWNSSNTPDMFINQDGSIHCWTNSPFKNNTRNHGDLIDFLMIDGVMNFSEAKKEAYRLLGLPIPSIESYKDNGYSISSHNKKDGFIPKDYVVAFEEQRKENFERYKELLNEALPSLSFEKQKEIAKKYQIGYIKESDRLCMPIKDEYENIITFWKYNKNPKPYVNKNGIEVKPGKVLFSKGRTRCPFNLSDLLEYRKNKNDWIFLCAGEKDTLNMLGNGYKAITLGSENKDIDKKYLPLFKDLKIIVVYDYDKAGLEGSKKIEKQLQTVTKNVKVWDWELLAIQENFKLFKGFDLTDWLCLKKEV